MGVLTRLRNWLARPPKSKILNYAVKLVVDRLHGLILCTALTLIATGLILFNSGFVSAGDLVPPFDAKNYFEFVASPWNHAYSFGNVGASSSGLFSLPLFFFHFVLGIDTLLADKLWIVFNYWMSSIVFYEVTMIVLPSNLRWGTISRVVATSVFMLSPITITQIIVPALLLSGPPIFLALLELKRTLEFRSTNWGPLRFSAAMMLAGFYYPSVFFAMIFSALIVFGSLLINGNRIRQLVRAGTLAIASAGVNFFWILPLATSFFSQGSLFGTSIIQPFNINELYADWSAQFGWSALPVLSLTRTVLVPSMAYAPANAIVVGWMLAIVGFAMLASLVSPRDHRKLALALSLATVSILFLAIRDHPIIDFLAFGLTLMWNSNVPLRNELWNLLKQPSIMISYLPSIYALLAGLSFFGIFNKLTAPRQTTLHGSSVRESYHPTTLTRIREFCRWACPQQRTLIGILVCALIVASLTATSYEYSGQLYRALNPSPLPQEFYSLDTYFQNHPDSGRTLFLPPRSWGGVTYGWWPTQGIHIVTWPLYAATPPSQLLDSSTPQAANYLLYVYLQGLIRGRTTELGQMVAPLGGTYVAYSSQFLTPGLDVPPEKIIGSLQNQTALSSVLTDNSIHLYRIDSYSSQVYATNSLGIIVGGLSTLMDSYKDGYNATRAPLAFAYQLDTSSYDKLLNLSKYLVVSSNDGLVGPTLLLCSQYFIQPSLVQAPGWSSVPESSINFVFDGVNHDIAGDVLYGGTAAVTRTSNSTLSLTTTSSEGNYDFWARVETSPSGGTLRVQVDGRKLSTMYTNESQTGMQWINLGAAHLPAGTHKIDLVNVYGLNAVNVLGVLPSGVYESSHQRLLQILAKQQVYVVGPNNLQSYDVSDNMTKSAPTISIQDQPLPVDYQMPQQGYYTATFDSSRPTFVILTEYFDSAFISSEATLHFPTQYLMNGYVVNSTGPTTITMRYSPTTLVNSARIVSIISGATIFGLAAIYPSLRRRLPSRNAVRELNAGNNPIAT